MCNTINEYTPPSIEILNERFGELQELFELFLEYEKDKGVEFHIHKHNVFEIFKRVDERIYYLNAIHQLDSPCEYKYIAMLCFWINTLKPFMITDEKANIYDCPNESFSLFLILSTIRTVFEIYKPNNEFKLPHKKRQMDILYDFKYCSLSREAMISFVETFADTYGVGINFIHENNEEISKKLKDFEISKLWANL